ncbi:MAG TPA: hypothetical protein VMA77_12480 [Solirubrobacteraceae bacterium]|nr:hypothetical protein [Solirubrobacteraceae bacterium]
MARFTYLYRGPAPDLTPEQDTDRTRAFVAWVKQVGAALIDVGSPFGASTSVRDDGTEGPAGDLIGCTIVESDDLRFELLPMQEEPRRPRASPGDVDGDPDDRQQRVAIEMRTLRSGPARAAWSPTRR